MTDLDNHSEGYWRSIFIYREVNSVKGFKYDYFKYLYNVIIPEQLKATKLKYILQCYGGSEYEEEHITFRILFPTKLQEEMFENFLKDKNVVWQNRNYDEPIWIKEAYVLGTKLADEFQTNGVLYDKKYDMKTILILLHGFFNAMGYYKSTEIKLLTEIVLHHLRALGW